MASETQSAANQPPVLQSPQPSGGGNLLVSLLKKKESGVFLALVVLVVLVSCIQPKFVSSNNIFILSRQVAFTAIMALGVFFVILTSGIDLSIGSTVSLTGVICGWAMSTQAPGLFPGLYGNPAALVAIGIAFGIIAGALVGVFNASIVSYLGVTPFIVTLGSMGMGRGIVLLITGGSPIQNIPDSYLNFGTSDVFGIPVPVIVLLVIAVIAHVALTYTTFGRRLYALGGNEEATRLSGINVAKLKFFAYVISGMLCAVTGMLYITRFGSAQANAGLGQEMDAIAAAVIGGTSLMGGEGSVVGVLLGAAIMGVIRTALPMMGVSPYWQDFIIGGIIVLAAILDKLRTSRR